MQQVPDPLVVFVELEAWAVERSDREIFNQHFVPRLGSAVLTFPSPISSSFVISKSTMSSTFLLNTRPIVRLFGFFSCSICVQLKAPEDEQRCEVLDSEELEVGGIFERSDLISPLQLGVEVSSDIELLSSALPGTPSRQ